MKTILILSAFVTGTWMLAGCSGPSRREAVATEATYQCPSCQETVEWTRGSLSKPVSPKVRVVTHSCPACKNEWSSNLSVTSTCETCQEKHLECPACRKHG